jgi:poly-gamma-glutamate biosynthesis protein PgsC/CapC
MVIEALFIGLVAGFLFYEATGISPGGVVAPGYIALFVNQPSKIGMTLLIAFGVWGILEFASARLILYGRRKLLLSLLLGFCIKLGIEQWIQPLPSVHVDLHSIGYVIPGLIANEFSRQKVLSTLSGLAIVSVIVALAMLLIKN